MTNINQELSKNDDYPRDYHRIREEISKLICQANNYEGDNIYQDVFYQADLVDVDATADGSGTVFLICGDMLMWDEKDKEWC